MDYLFLKLLHQTAITLFVTAMTIALLGLIARHYMAPEKWVKTAKTMRIVVGIPSSLGVTLAWVFGIWMAVKFGWYLYVWFWLKMVMVTALSGVHGRVSNRYRMASKKPISDTLGSDITLLLVFTTLVLVTLYLVFFKPFL